VILLQELFATPYFCIEQSHKHQALAEEYRDSRCCSVSPPWPKSWAWCCR
jgi:hypothetical protein